MPISQLGTVNGAPYKPTNTIVSNVATAAGMTFGLLNQRHDCYDEKLTKKLKLLLQGGEAITKRENAKIFMPQWNAENSKAYQDRLSFATYENNFGGIINDLAATLFSKPVSVMEETDADDDGTPGEEPDEDSPHMQWQSHFTLDGKPMADFMHVMQTESNAIGCAYYGVDFMEDGSTPYAYYIDPCSVLDYEKDDAGDFVFVVLRADENKRTKVRQLRDETTTTFSVWTRNPEDPEAPVKFEQYQIKYPKNQPPNADQVVPKIKTPTDISFKCIPIIDCPTPDNLAMAKLIGQPAAMLYQKTTTYHFCLNRGLNPILAYTQGFEMPAKGDLSVINEDESRGDSTLKTAPPQGKAILGPNDKLEWVAMDASVFTIAQTQLDKDKNELYRLASSLTSIIGHQGVSTAQTRSSGEAKSLDNAAKEHRLC